MLNNKYYTEFFEIGQQKINFSFFELSLPDDDPVYTLKKVMEDFDFSGLLARYSTDIVKISWHIYFKDITDYATSSKSS